MSQYQYKMLKIECLKLPPHVNSASCSRCLVFHLSGRHKKRGWKDSMKIAYRKKDTSIYIFSWLLLLQLFILRRKLNQYRIVLCAFNYLFLLRTCYKRHLTCELWAALVLCFLTLSSNFYPVLWLWLKVSQYGEVETGNLY